MSLLDAMTTPRKPMIEMKPSQVNTLCLSDIPDRFKDRILACVNQQLEALGSLSTHVRSYPANMNEYLEIITQQEETRVLNKIEKIDKIKESFNDSLAKFTSSFEELESTTIELDVKINNFQTSTVSDIFKKEVAKAVSYQIQSEMNQLVEDNSLTVERKLQCTQELKIEVEKVIERSEDMSKLYKRGEAAYNGLYSLGEGFEMYSKEELDEFMGSSFLQWLKEEKFIAKYEDMKGLVSDWESLYEKEMKVKESTFKKLENIMQDDDVEDDTVIQKNVIEDTNDVVNIDKNEKENKTCASTKRFQNAMKAEREKKRMREEKMKKLVNDKKRKAQDAKQIKDNATQHARMKRSA